MEIKVIRHNTGLFRTLARVVTLMAGFESHSLLPKVVEPLRY